MRAEGAVCSDHLNILVLQNRGGEERIHVAVGCAFFRKGQLRNDGQTRKRADGINGQRQFIDIGKCFEYEEIHAALFERQGLFVKNVEDLFGFRMARLYTNTERANGTGDQDFACRGFAGFAGDFDAAAIQALHVIA